MRLCAGRADGKLTLLPRSSTTSRTTDAEYLFQDDGSFAGGFVVLGGSG